MSRHHGFQLAVLFLLVPLAGPRPASATQAQAPRSTDEEKLLQALAADPSTAPYAFSARRNGRNTVLAGRVGTKAIHDVAIRIAIDLGVQVEDRLVIDTAEAFRSATPSPTAGPIPYVYPPPLFGYVDNPFYGFEPPLISYPPWWGPMSAQRRVPTAALPVQPAQPAQPAPAGAIPTGSVELSVDPLGYGVLRGTVPNEEARLAIAEKASRMAGVTGIINRLEIAPQPDAISAQPPPPPEPYQEADPPPPPTPEPVPAPPTSRPPVPGTIQPAPERPTTGDLTTRARASLGRRPTLAGLPISVDVQDRIATLSGTVPSVLEAMLAFRAIQQTPGIDRIVDRLAFAPPEPGAKNPLLQQGRPEDVEPYLEAQIRRQLGDQAHLDRVRLRGDVLAVEGTVRSESDQARISAILPSLPVLRGFRIDAHFQPE